MYFMMHSSQVEFSVNTGGSADPHQATDGETPAAMHPRLLDAASGGLISDPHS